MANEDILKEIERLEEQEIVYAERMKLRHKLQALKDKEWARQHPRLAKFKSMFGGI